MAGRKIKKLLVTAGPTRERLDPVRYLSNFSSGKMGYAIAQAAKEAGFEVILVSGPVALSAPNGVELINVESAAEMAEAVQARFPMVDAVIMTAAVADYRPCVVAENKIKKSENKLFIELERTQDILGTLGQAKQSGQRLIGFAAETEALLANAEKKLKAKNLDWIAANDVSDCSIGFGSEVNRITLLGASGERISLPQMDKLSLARELLKIVLG